MTGKGKCNQYSEHCD